MRLMHRISAVALVAILSIGSTVTSAADGSFKVTTGERQLFLDDFGIETIQDLDRTMHQPSKMGAVIRPNKFIGEEAVQTRGVPAWDPTEKLFKLWVSGSKNFCRTSPDGLHWSIADYPRPGAESVSVIYDSAETDPSRRYKADRGGGGFSVSPDGIHWTKLDVPGIPSSDESNFSYNPKDGLFIHTGKRGGPHGRSVALATSRDFETWTDYGVVFHADDLDQELGRENIKTRLADATLEPMRYNDPGRYNVDVYNMGVFRYEGLYIGTPALFHATGPHPNYPNTDGFHLVQLVCSRNLKNWRRLGDRQMFIGPSRRDSGAYDLTQIIGPSNAVSRGDELWFYYTGIKYRAAGSDYVGKYPAGKWIRRPGFDTDGGAICLAVLRRDGFISLDATDAEGIVQTRPFASPGSKLFVNVDAPKGNLRVEVLDGEGNVVARSEPLSGDLLREPVKWAKGNIADLKGQTASLRFTLRNGQFYSYWLE